MIVKASAKGVNEIQYAFMTEEDPAFAKEAMPGLIKIAEGMYHFYPKHSYYASKLCFLYAAYTFAYLDDTPFSDFDPEVDAKREKLNRYYLKAFHYGLKALNQRVPDFKSAVKMKPLETLARFKERDVEALFWTAFSWAMLIFNNTDDPKRVIELETVKYLADRVRELNEDYLHGIVYAIPIAYYGGRSKAIGGNREQADRYYKRALSKAQGKSLVADFVYLRFVTIQDADASQFQRLFDKIARFEVTKEADFRFINEVILDKAKKLVEKKADLF